MIIPVAGHDPAISRARIGEQGGITFKLPSVDAGDDRPQVIVIAVKAGVVTDGGGDFCPPPPVSGSGRVFDQCIDCDKPLPSSNSGPTARRTPLLIQIFSGGARAR